MNDVYVHLLEAGFGVVFTALLAMIGYWVRRLEKDMDANAARVERIEEDLVSFRETVAVGKTEINSLRQVMERYVERAETLTVKRMDEIEKSKAEQHAKLFDLISNLSGDVRELSGMLVQYATNNDRRALPRHSRNHED